ncbi:MAG TPA: IS1380 family transposase [Bryobacteraceae bacterium]|nr:IS1380 family transposase [Bryobacteraceae bacterium]
MALKPKQSPAAGEFLFTIDPEPLEEAVTAWGGVPLLVRALRSLDVPGSVARHVHVKQRQRGLDEASYVSSFVALNALGGDCLDDFERLREDEGLPEMLGHPLPSPEAARKFLYQFHDEETLEQAQRELPVGQVSYIPEESAALRGLAQVNQDAVQEVGRRCGDQKIATVDLDATVIESWKREAQPTYQGGKGYQPVLALWAEMNLALAEEFRDGNVPAHTALLPVAQRAFAALPETVKEHYFRGDAACWEQQLVSWLRDEKRADGPQGFIGFAISVRMTPTLHEHIARIPESVWKPYREDPEMRSECADVLNYWPQSEADRAWGALRYVAIRVRPRQRDLWGPGEGVKYFAVATNMWKWPAERLLEWHREKAGSIEALHDVLKNELAAGVLPCGRFGANAAWLRLAVLTHNVLTALKRLALPPELLAARPKRLRFLIFQTPGKLVHHARQMVLRLKRAREKLSAWLAALQHLPLPTGT